MNNYTKEDILRMAEEQDVEFVRLQFCDIFGTMKNVAITVSQLEKALDNHCRIEGGCIPAFGELANSELYLHPDYNTFTIFPWRPQQGKVARLICDVYEADGKPYAADTRRVLKNVVKIAANMGYRILIEPECEFFLFHIDDDGAPTTITHEQAGYFDVGPVDFAENVRRDMVLNLEEMGFEIRSSHHEKAPGQHEIDFKYSDPLSTADKLQTFKMTVKSIAKRHGLHATFMPKPKSDVDGSGMHLNIYLYDKNGNNVFYDENDPEHISKEARCFMAGIMSHISGMTALTNPLINSYKRLVPGFEAPAYVTWSAKQSYSLIRVPAFRKNYAKIELRSPDPTGNPYLAFAAVLACGLMGIKNDMEIAAPIDENVAEWTDERRKFLDIKRLPNSIEEAIHALENDGFLIRVIGKETTEQYVKIKRREWIEYRRQVTKWEIDKYLNLY